MTSQRLPAEPLDITLARVAIRDGNARVITGADPTHARGQIERAIESIVIRLYLEPGDAEHGRGALVDTEIPSPLVTLWPDVLASAPTETCAAELLEQLLDELGGIELIEIAQGCDGRHAGRCLLSVCAEVEVRLRWATRWHGVVNGHLVATWEPERIE